jgi:hypothetical protein
MNQAVEALLPRARYIRRTNAPVGCSIAEEG